MHSERLLIEEIEERAPAQVLGRACAWAPLEPAPLGLAPLELELVVARYQESLNWLRKVPAAIGITVYDKGGQGTEDVLPILPRARAAASAGPEQSSAARQRERASVISLPNVGREAHSYLHHISARLQDRERPLAALTVFCQGRPFDHAFDFHHTLRALAASPEASLGLEPWRWLGHAIDTDTRDGALFQSWSKNPAGSGLDLDGFHRALLGRAGPQEYAFVLGGQFVARRELLERRGPEFWKHALELSVSWPEAAHCFERSWALALGARGPTLGPGRRTAHLKKISGQSKLS